MSNPKDALLFAAINCSHHIEGEKITLEFDFGAPGKNALNQLSVRLEAAFEACAAAHLTRIAELNGANARQTAVIAELRRADEVAHARSLQQAQIIATLANQKAELELQLAAPRGTDAQIRKERELCAFAFAGAVADGATGGAGPVGVDSEWQRAAFNVGQEIAGLRAKLATETGRLDFVIKESAFIERYATGSQLKAACQFGEEVVISGDGFHPTPRAAIDAAIVLSKGGA